MRIREILTITTLVIGQLFTPYHIVSATEHRIDTVKVAPAEQVIRAAFDVGSGETKLTVAAVNPTTNKIITIFYQTFKKIELRKDLATSADNTLSQKAENDVIQAIKTMQAEVIHLEPKEWNGVATSVFRTAKNAQQFLDNVKAATGVEIRIVPQTEEGEIGFTTAVAASNEAADNIIAWDSGAGSFQMTTLINGSLEMYGAEFAFIPSLEALFAYRNQPFSASVSPHPIYNHEVIDLIKIIKQKLPPLPDWIVNNNKKIISFGGRSIFELGKLAIGHAPFTKQEVLEIIFSLTGKTDADYSNFKYYNPKHIIVALTLLYAMMDHCGYEEIDYCNTNGNCEGLLIMPRFWQ